jgi:DNA-binding NarL/FixJ family response regulator
MSIKSNISVFLVDDDRLFLRSLSHYLRQSVSDIHIMEFYTGEDCLKELHLKPQIIFLDYQLSADAGHRNGLSILKSIRHRSPATFSVIVSSSHDRKLHERLFDNEAVAIIPKDSLVFEHCKEEVIAVRAELAAAELLTGRNNSRSLLYLLAGLIIALLLLILFR